MEEQIKKEAELIAKKLGYYIWDIKILRGKTYLVKIFIEKQDKITIEDCEKFTKLIKPVIEVKEIIKGPYILEVSSPGIERELKYIYHFKNSIGKKIKIKTKDKIEQKNIFCGHLIYADDKLVRIKMNGKLIDITMEQIKKANVIL